MAKYQTVNSQWPDTLPPLTEQEALSAVRRLWRFTMKRKLPYKLSLGKLRGRSVDIFSRGMVVDPRRGWHGLVHSMSHRCHYRLHGHTKTYDSHDARHAWIEREMIRYVVESGWLDGKLKRPEKTAKVVDLKAVRLARILARQKAWEKRRKRAETALKKLRRQRIYYERQQVAA